MNSEQLDKFCQEFIPQGRMPTSEYIDSLAPSERVDALLACALVWTLSGGAEVPREFQLKAGLAAVSGRDCVVRAGTGANNVLSGVKMNVEVAEDDAEYGSIGEPP
jgi:hypothetical protein